MGMYAEIDLNSLTKALDDKKKQIEAAARPAAKAIADVYYEAVRSNVAALGKSTGNLYNAIYRVYSEDRSKDGRQIYEISWNKRKAPHGRLIEHGYMRRYHIMYDPNRGEWVTLSKQKLKTPVQVAARPFLRPALDLSGQAKQAGVARLKELISKPQS